MLSDLILEHKGKTTSNRVLDADIQKIETTVTARGKVIGSLDVSIIITYWNMPRSIMPVNNNHNESGTSQYYYGEGKGIILLTGEGYDNQSISVAEYGIGKLTGSKTVWRGSAFYRISSPTSSGKLSFLNNTVGVFETEVDNISSDVSEKVWEWK
jgi:hypothetical protein